MKKRSITSSGSEQSKKKAKSIGKGEPPVECLVLSLMPQNITLSKLMSWCTTISSRYGSCLGNGSFGAVHSFALTCEPNARSLYGAMKIIPIEKEGVESPYELQLMSDVVEATQMRQDAICLMKCPRSLMKDIVTPEKGKKKDKEGFYAGVLMPYMFNSVTDMMENPSMLPFDLKVVIALDVLLCLLRLHRENVLHLDVKSCNVMLPGYQHFFRQWNQDPSVQNVVYDTDEWIKFNFPLFENNRRHRAVLTDFGLAVPLLHGQYYFGVATRITYVYRAPEIVLRKYSAEERRGHYVSGNLGSQLDVECYRYSKASDVWALGIFWLQLFDESINTLCKTHTSESTFTPALLKQLASMLANKQLPAGFNVALLGMLDRNEATRWDLEQVQECLMNEPSLQQHTYKEVAVPVRLRLHHPIPTLAMEWALFDNPEIPAEKRLKLAHGIFTQVSAYIDMDIAVYVFYMDNVHRLQEFVTRKTKADWYKETLIALLHLLLKALQYDDCSGANFMSVVSTSDVASFTLLELAKREVLILNWLEGVLLRRHCPYYFVKNRQQIRLLVVLQKLQYKDYKLLANKTHQALALGQDLDAPWQSFFNAHDLRYFNQKTSEDTSVFVLANTLLGQVEFDSLKEVLTQ